MSAARCIPLGSALLLALLGAAPALAQTAITGKANGGVTLEGSTHARVEVLDSTGWVEGSTPTGLLHAAASLMAPEPLVGTRGSFSAWAQSGLAGLHLHATAFALASHHSDGLTTRANSGANADGRLVDFFTLNVPSYAPGTLFTVTGQLHVDGTSSNSADLSLLDLNGYPSSGLSRSTSTWESHLTIKRDTGSQDLVALHDHGECAADGRTAGVSCSGAVPGWRSFSFQMPNQSWSVQVSMNAWLSASAVADIAGVGSASSDAATDFGNTIAWGGITELRDPSGQWVSNFSAISSSSGYDYRNAYVSAVPEVPSLALMAAGLAMMGLRLRRRRSLPQAAAPRV